MNYGWMGPSTAWYTLDNLLLGDPPNEYAIVDIKPSCNDVPVRPELTVAPLPPCVTEQYCVSWGAVPGATSYEVRENTAEWADIGNVTQQCYSKSIGEGGFYIYGVRAKNNCGTGVAGNLGFFVHDAVPPPQSLSISAGEICVNQPYCVSWEQASGASSYEIRENSGTWIDIGNVTQWCNT
jgi:hypothetical protein